MSVHIMITALQTEILEALKECSMTDRSLTDKILGAGKPQQRINAACRQLAAQGFIYRSPPPIQNRLVDAKATSEEPKPPTMKQKQLRVDKSPATTDSHLSEETVKTTLNDWLQAQGWRTQVAWGNQHGIDINAWRDQEHWGIEVKGCGSRPEMRVNYFISILGELLQRMDDPNARYSIALPDIQQYRNLWMRIPWLAKNRTKIDVIFVSTDGSIHVEK